MSEALPFLETREEVMFFDTDCGGVVHNLAYLRMIETCRTRLAASMGMNLLEMSATRLFPVLTRTEVDYKRPAKLGDWIRIRGRLDSLTRARFWCALRCSGKAMTPCLSPRDSHSPWCRCRKESLPGCRTAG